MLKDRKAFKGIQADLFDSYNVWYHMALGILILSLVIQAIE